MNILNNFYIPDVGNAVSEMIATHSAINRIIKAIGHPAKHAGGHHIFRYPTLIPSTYVMYYYSESRKFCEIVVNASSKYNNHTLISGYLNTILGFKLNVDRINIPV